MKLKSRLQQKGSRLFVFIIVISQNRKYHHANSFSLTHTVVTQAAVGGTWRSEDLAGEAILQFDCLAIDDHLFSPGRGSVARTAIGHIFGKIRKRQSQYKYNLFILKTFGWDIEPKLNATVARKICCKTLPQWRKIPQSHRWLAGTESLGMNSTKNNWNVF